MTAETPEHRQSEKVQRSRERVADANKEAAKAVSRLADANPGHPGMALRNTHGALQDLLYEAVRAINVVEQALGDNDAHSQPTPKEIVSEHSDRFEERYTGPVLFLAKQLLEANRREWLQRKPDTMGAEAVERHGLTTNQRDWLDQLQGAWEASDDE